MHHHSQNRICTEKISIYDNIQYPNETYKFRFFFFFFLFWHLYKYCFIAHTESICKISRFSFLWALCSLCFCDGGINDIISDSMKSVSINHSTVCVYILCAREILHQFISCVIYIYSINLSVISISIQIRYSDWTNSLMRYKRVRVCLVWSAQSKTKTKQSKSSKKKKTNGKRVPNVQKARKNLTENELFLFCRA